MRWLSRLITLVVLATVALGVGLFIRARLPSSELGQSFTTWAKFRDASKLVLGSPVMIAGVRIGEITGLTIEGRFARVDMRLRDDTDIAVDSFVTKRAPSTFGDSYLEIIPAGGDQGAPTQRRLRSGEPLTHIIEGSSTDNVLRATERSMPRLEAALEALHSLMANGRSWVNGSIVGGLTTVNTWLEAGHLQGPLRSTDDALERIERATDVATDALGGTDHSMFSVLDGVDSRITRTRKSIADSKQSIVTALGDTRSGLDGVDEQIARVSEVVAAVHAGSGDDWQGRLGRLVSDPELADTLEDAAEAGREATSSFNRFKAHLAIRLETSVVSKLTRVYLTAEIHARNDKLYIVELEKGLLGGVPTDTLSDSVGSSAWTRTQTINDKLRFSAQFGKVFGAFRLRGGIKDSEFGVGADFLSGRLNLSADIFGSWQRVPNLKLAAALMIFRSVYVVGGVDDTLNPSGDLTIAAGTAEVPMGFTRLHFGRDVFLGAQLRFTDTDITTLLRVYGALLAGIL